ncbi:hypothetical protein COLO4_12758 [Corchorus olitorius]|uniref:Uncharacterized protein n=1 Tax=Corchorus olitorius TaxID=93759 RepID=A0A1R3JZT9_9ROSI|nr:hypothetical protein COLO4_12758 [Corchorus olitorius]
MAATCAIDNGRSTTTDFEWQMKSDSKAMTN